VSDPEFRHELFHTQGLAGRAMLVGGRGSGLYGDSLFREQTAGFFSESEKQAIQSIADTLISCVARHHDLMARDTSLCALFSSVEELAALCHHSLRVEPARMRGLRTNHLWDVDEGNRPRLGKHSGNRDHVPQARLSSPASHQPFRIIAPLAGRSGFVTLSETARLDATLLEFMA
jgi:hypothetical protein